MRPVSQDFLAFHLCASLSLFPYKDSISQCDQVLPCFLSWPPSSHWRPSFRRLGKRTWSQSQMVFRDMHAHVHLGGPRQRASQHLGTFPEIVNVTRWSPLREYLTGQRFCEIKLLVKRLFWTQNQKKKKILVLVWFNNHRTSGSDSGNSKDKRGADLSTGHGRSCPTFPRSEARFWGYIQVSGTALESSSRGRRG